VVGIKIDKIDIWMMRHILLQILKEDPKRFEDMTGLKAEDWRDKLEVTLGFC
jgi:hypothetical protein